jgi:hypothetical protein
MSDYIFDKVCDRLTEFNDEGLPYVVVLGDYGETTLDKQLDSRVAKLKKCIGSENKILLHTNGVILRKEPREELLSNVDSLFLSILGGLKGKYSYTAITGIDFEENIDFILSMTKRFKREITLLITLPSLYNSNEIELMTERLKGSNIYIVLNTMLHSSEYGRMTHTNSKDFSMKVYNELLATGVNGLYIFQDESLTINKENCCTWLATDTVVFVDGSYGVCAARTFGSKTSIPTVVDTSITSWIAAREPYRKFMSAHNKETFLTCSNCVLQKTFKFNC